MNSWDLLDWHRTFNKAQRYLLNRIVGDDCDRDLVEAWRTFYQTHEPLVRMTVRREGLSGRRLEQCVREVWLELLTGVPKLRKTSTRDFFLGWLNQRIRSKVADFLLHHAGKDSPDVRGHVDLGNASSSVLRSGKLRMDESQADQPVSSSVKQAALVNAQLFQMRVVEERAVSDVARTLGLTSTQVRLRQHRMLDKLFSVLIQLDA